MKLKKIDKRKKSKSKSKSKTREENKPKLPKQFYDDGLGEILDWIDTEILDPAELKRLKNRDKNGVDDGNKLTNKPNKKSTKLYGDNDTQLDPLQAPRRVKFNLPDDSEAPKVDKTVSDRTRGLINRLTAQTMPFVTSEFEKLYSSHSRQDIDAALFNTIESSIINSNTLTKRKLVAELMLLASYLNYSISQGIGASLVHRLVQRFEHLYKLEPDPSDMSSAYQDDPDKRMENILSCLANLYIIGMISSNVIFEVAKRINEGFFRPKSVELLLFILKSIGFHLRKDPTPMRLLILKTQENCKELEKLCGLDSRIKFMVEALTAIKNNNVSKLENYGCDIDTSTIEQTMKSLIQRTKLPICLSDATYDEILNSCNWYLLETRIDETNADKSDTQVAANQIAKVKLTQMEEKVCKALRLNKPAEKTIFSALSKASDYIEACNVVLGFGLTHCSDTMSVCVNVAIHEKKYNPFYFNVINNLAKHNRRYKMAAKFAIQDKIRIISELKQSRVDIFKKLCFELIRSNAVPITILKAVEWANLNSCTKDYLVFLFDQISQLAEEERRAIMSKVERKSSFAAAMRTFSACFLEDCHLFK